MAACLISWLPDIKSNVTNELLDPKNHKISRTRFYFDELERTFVLGIVNVFKMAAISGHVTTRQ